MKILSFVLALVFFIGCSNTWQGVKDDTNSIAEWTKKKVNDGASYVKEKTE